MLERNMVEPIQIEQVQIGDSRTFITKILNGESLRLGTGKNE